MKKQHLARLAIAIDVGAEGELPTEFRLFVPGMNETEKGPFLFDAEGATATMAANAAWGLDRTMIDLEHQSLEPFAPADPTARDARGWCVLELRPNGELWAVSATWTPDGAARLREKRQRFISPAFEYEPDTKRIVKVVNIALTALPATHGTQALIAASATSATGDTCMLNADQITKALDALMKGDQKACMQILKDIVAAAAAGDAEDATPPAGDGGADETTEGAAAGAAATPPPAATDDKAKDTETAAAAARLMRLTGKSSFVEAVEEVDTYRTSHLELATEREKLSKERATLELAERRKLCVELVTLGAEFPSTVWADEKATSLKPRWLEMPIAQLREHTAEQRSVRGGKRGSKPEIAPPAAGGAHGLTPEQLAICKEMGCEPQVFANLKRSGQKAGS